MSCYPGCNNDGEPAQRGRGGGRTPSPARAVIVGRSRTSSRDARSGAARDAVRPPPASADAGGAMNADARTDGPRHAKAAPTSAAGAKPPPDSAIGCCGEWQARAVRMLGARAGFVAAASTTRPTSSEARRPVLAVLKRTEEEETGIIITSRLRCHADQPVGDGPGRPPRRGPRRASAGSRLAHDGVGLRPRRGASASVRTCYEPTRAGSEVSSAGPRPRLATSSVRRVMPSLG